MIPFAWAFLTVLVQYDEVTPLPAESPIEGPLWSVVIPALLLAVACLGTLLLYRHFAGQDRN